MYLRGDYFQAQHRPFERQERLPQSILQREKPLRLLGCAWARLGAKKPLCDRALDPNVLASEIWQPLDLAALEFLLLQVT